MHFFSALIRDLHEYEWVGALIARMSVGLLFVLSGGGKLFVPKKAMEMQETIRKAGVPSPKVSAKILSTLEFVFGAFLVLGFLTPLACVILIGLMIAALVTTVLPAVKESSFLAWLAAFLYLPEVLYVVILFWLLLSGPGVAAVDNFIGKGV